MLGNKPPTKRERIKIGAGIWGKKGREGGGLGEEVLLPGEGGAEEREGLAGAGGGLEEGVGVAMAEGAVEGGDDAAHESQL